MPTGRYINAPDLRPRVSQMDQAFSDYYTVFRLPPAEDMTADETQTISRMAAEANVDPSELLGKLQKRLEALTASDVAKCLELLKPLASPDEVTAVLVNFHPHVVYMLATQCGAALYELAAYKGLEPLQRKEELRMIRSAAELPEHRDDAEWYRREYMRQLIRLGGDEHLTLLRAYMELRKTRAVEVSELQMLVEVGVKDAALRPEAQTALAVCDLKTSYAELRRLGPVSDEEIDQMVASAGLKGAQGAWFRTTCALRRIQVASKRALQLVDQIIQTDSRRALAELLDSQDEEIVYEACKNHMDRISRGVMPHIGLEVVNMCNALVARCWRARNPQEAEAMEREHLPALVTAYGEENYAQALDNLQAALARGHEVEKPEETPVDDAADSIGSDECMQADSSESEDDSMDEDE